MGLKTQAALHSLTHPHLTISLTDGEAEPINAERGTPALFESLFFEGGLCHLAPEAALDGELLCLLLSVCARLDRERGLLVGNRPQERWRVWAAPRLRCLKDTEGGFSM